MWTRKELKEKAKEAFKFNYWKTVLVSLIVVAILGGTLGGDGNLINARPRLIYNFGKNDTTAEAVPGDGEPGSQIEEFGPFDIEGFADAITENISEEEAEEFEDTLNGILSVSGVAFLFGVVGLLMVLVLVVSAVAIALNAFLFNPLEAGSSRFFLRNLNTKASVGEITYCYDHSYLNCVKTIFMKDLRIFLWSLLFLIPGFIKGFEYYMVSYIVAEHPEMPYQEALERSRAMMEGHKWNAFVLELSFLGWEILSLLTVGILGIFYVNPYRHMTKAALYERLAYGQATPEVQTAGNING